MRNEKEIRRATEILEAVFKSDEWSTHPLDAKGDNFKYGMFIGKLAALGWVLGDESCDLKIHYDFDGFSRAQKQIGGDIHERLERDKRSEGEST
jgi:hypothetical protein